MCRCEICFSSMPVLFSAWLSMSFENYSLNSSCESNKVGMMKWRSAQSSAIEFWIGVPLSIWCLELHRAPCTAIWFDWNFCNQTRRVDSSWWRHENLHPWCVNPFGPRIVGGFFVGSVIPTNKSQKKMLNSVSIGATFIDSHVRNDFEAWNEFLHFLLPVVQCWCRWNDKEWSPNTVILSNVTKKGSFFFLVGFSLSGRKIFHALRKNYFNSKRRHKDRWSESQASET